MSEPVTPLLFPETFNSPGLWKELGKAHGLAEKDFRWLAHLKLTTDTLRRQQTPAMITEQILLNVDKQAPIRLPGSFVIRSTPDDNGEILYTPYDGLKKYATRDALRTQLQERLNSSDEQTSLFAFLAFSQRKLLRDGGKITLSFATISGDVFEDQADSIKQGQTLNAQALHEELKRLPVLKQMLEGALGHLLREHFGNLSQSQTRVRFSAPSSEQVTTADRDWPDTLTLSEAVLFITVIKAGHPDEPANSPTPAGTLWPVTRHSGKMPFGPRRASCQRCCSGSCKTSGKHRQPRVLHVSRCSDSFWRIRAAPSSCSSASPASSMRRSSTRCTS